MLKNKTFIKTMKKKIPKQNDKQKAKNKKNVVNCIEIRMENCLSMTTNLISLSHSTTSSNNNFYSSDIS